MGLLVWCALSAGAFGAAGGGGGSGGALVAVGPVESVLADQLVILARRALAAVGDPREDQLVRAGILLDLSVGLNPGDAGVWRLQSELALRTGEVDRDVRALREYCRLMPDDDVAQLRLISHLLDGEQTLDGRSAMAKRLVDGRAAKRLPAGVRSRLAVMLAESAMEGMDVAGAAARVGQALSLDGTNRRAAEMAYQLAAGAGGGDLTGVGRALLGVVRADPLNSGARQALAQLLLATGVYESAADQFAVAWGTGAQQLDPSFFFRWAWSISASGGHVEALNLLANYEFQLRARQQQAGAATQPGAAAAIPVDLELLRLVIARRAGQSEVVLVTTERLREHYRQRIEAGDAQARFDWTWYALFFDLGPIVGADVDTVAEILGADHPATARVRGWYLIREGRLDEARGVLEGSAGVDPFAAYGMAVATPEEGGRARWLHHTLSLTRETTAGLLAVYELGGRHQPSAEGRALGKAIKGWPSQLSRPTPEPNRWARLRVEPDAKTYGYLDPIVVKVELYNPMSMELSLGSSATMPSRLFIYTLTSKSGTALPEFPPVVVDLGRAISLAPRETVTVDVRLDRTELGALLTSNPFDTLTIAATAVLDPRPSAATGKPAPGMLGARASMPIILRQGSKLHAKNVEHWIGLLGGESRSVRVRSMARLAKSLPAMIAGGPEVADLTEQIGDALVQYYHDSGVTSRALLVSLMDPVRRVRMLLEPIHESATRSDDVLIRVLYLATQVQDPASVHLTAGLRHSDPVVVAFTKALQAGLIAEREDD